MGRHCVFLDQRETNTPHATHLVHLHDLLQIRMEEKLYCPKDVQPTIKKESCVQKAQ